MNSSIDIRFYLTILKRRLPFFLFAALTVAAIGTWLVMSMPAIYTSAAKVLVESQQIPQDLVKSTVTDRANERIQIIEQRVMTRENLLALVDKFGLFKDRKNLTRSDLVDLMRDRTSIAPLNLDGSGKGKKGGGVTVAFTIGFDYENANVAAKVANELVTLVLDENVRGRATRATDTTKFLSDEETRLLAELDSIQSQIAQITAKDPDAVPAKLTYNMGLLERIQGNIVNTGREIQAQREQKRLMELEAEVKRAARGAGGGVTGQGLDAKIDALKAELVTKTSLYSETHPEVRSLRKQLETFEKQRDQAAASMKTVKAEVKPADPVMSIEDRILSEKLSTIDSAIALLEQQRDALTKQADALKQTIDRTPEIGNSLVELQRRQDGVRKSLDDIATKLADARLGQRLEESQQAERFEVIEPAGVPQAPVKPARDLLLAAVAAFAAFSGIATSVGTELMDGSIKRSRDIVTKLQQRPLVVVPYITTRNETRKRRIRGLIFLLALAAVVLVSIILVLLLVPTFDVYFYSILNKLNFTK